MEEVKMKKLIAGIAVMIAVVGFSGNQAKADYDTLHGVADIVYAAGTVFNPGYSEVVYYDPYPYYHRSYYHPYRSYYNHHYYPRHRYYHCY